MFEPEVESFEDVDVNERGDDDTFTFASANRVEKLQDLVDEVADKLREEIFEDEVHRIAQVLADVSADLIKSRKLIDSILDEVLGKYEIKRGR